MPNKFPQAKKFGFPRVLSRRNTIPANALARSIVSRQISRQISRQVSRQEKPLYETNNSAICYADFIQSLKKVGIQQKDIIFVHSDISVFGKLCTPSRSFLLKNLINALKETVGKTGTIVMPTFTYSFCKGEAFDVNNTCSNVGVLTEFFRKQPKTTRTTHPIFSVAIWGKQKKELVKISKDSFDADSIFGKLHQLNGKIIFLGAPFRSCTYLHFIEQAHGVPYRHIKSFKGKIKAGGREYKDEYTYLVRYLDRDVILDTTKLENYLLNKKLMSEVKLGNSRILMVESATLLKEGCRLLDKDIYFFLKKAPK